MEVQREEEEGRGRRRGKRGGMRRGEREEEREEERQDEDGEEEGTKTKDERGVRAGAGGSRARVNHDSLLISRISFVQITSSDIQYIGLFL